METSSTRCRFPLKSPSPPGSLIFMKRVPHTRLADRVKAVGSQSWVVSPTWLRANPAEVRCPFGDPVIGASIAHYPRQFRTFAGPEVHAWLCISAVVEGACRGWACLPLLGPVGWGHRSDPGQMRPQADRPAAQAGTVATPLSITVEGSACGSAICPSQLQSVEAFRRVGKRSACGPRVEARPASRNRIQSPAIESEPAPHAVSRPIPVQGFALCHLKITRRHYAKPTRLIQRRGTAQSQSGTLSAVLGGVAR